MKKFGGICLVVGLIMLLNVGSISASTMSEDDIAEAVDTFMEEIVSRGNIPNAAISVVYRGEIILEKGYGYSNLDTKDSVNPEKTLFRIGSVSKLFTWTAIMQLVEQGKIDLDVDVNEYLDFPIPNYEDSSPITLRHLMTHTPGFEDYPEHIFKLEEEEMLPLNEYVRELLPERVFPAGEVLAYSNYGTALAGYIVEQVSDMPFSAYIDKNIFLPLQMNDSTFEQPLPEQLADGIATPYRFVDEHFAEGDFEFLPEPAGAMSTSASDMAKFMTAYLQEGQFNDEKILDKNTVGQMFEQQFTQHPKLNGMGLGFIEGNFNEQRTLFHGGGTMLYNSALYLLPDKDIGIFITYSGGNHYVHNEVFKQFLDEFFPVKEPAAIKSPDGAEERASHYVGEYHQNRKSFTTSEKFVSLMTGIISVKADKDGQLHVTHAGETNKFVEVEPGIFESARSERTPDGFGNFKRIIFEEEVEGNLMLMADGPMTYTKAPWYASSTFTIVMLACILLFIVATIFIWTFTAIIGVFRNRKKARSNWEILAKIVAIVYGVATISFFISIIINGEVDPIYQFPKSAYSAPPGGSGILDYILYLIVIFSIAFLIFTIVVWRKKAWSMFGRIHYSLYTIASLILVWLFYYWNFFI